MRIITALLVLLLSAAMALAQGPPPQTGPQLSPDVQSLVTQIHAIGCQAEEIGAAQTIDQLRKENEKLKAQLEKLDPPPKGGATKH